MQITTLSTRQLKLLETLNDEQLSELLTAFVESLMSRRYVFTFEGTEFWLGQRTAFYEYVHTHQKDSL
jgi:hypothetical protein